MRRADKSSKKLLDEFRQAGMNETDGVPSMTDEEYVVMMLEKEKARSSHKLASTDGLTSNPRSTETPLLRTESDQPDPLPLTLRELRDDVLESEAKRKALDTLARHRKDTPPPQRIGKVQKPTVSERVSPMRLCGNCYYCSDKRQVGGSWWCRCTNVGRSTSLATPASGWVKGKINLPCWRPVGGSNAESGEMKDWRSGEPPQTE